MLAHMAAMLFSLLTVWVSQIIACCVHLSLKSELLFLKAQILLLSQLCKTHAQSAAQHPHEENLTFAQFSDHGATNAPIQHCVKNHDDSALIQIMTSEKRGITES